MDNNLNLFKQALIEGLNQKIDSVISSCEETTEYSRNHNEKMTAILEGKITGKVVWTTRARVVAPLIAAAFLLTTCIMIYHNQIFTFLDIIPNISNPGDANMNNNASVQEFIKDIYELSYLPDGYTLTKIENHDIMIFNTYHNENSGTLIFAQYLNGVKPPLSSEDTIINTFVINNFEITEAFVDSKFVYIWKDNNYSMDITSIDQISKTELEKIIDGIIIVE